MHPDLEPASAWSSDGAVPRLTIGDKARDQLELTLAAGPHAPAQARAAVSEWLTGRVVDGVLDDARLLLSELVTNGLQHGV
jgi:hypothetical protein